MLRPWQPAAKRQPLTTAHSGTGSGDLAPGKPTIQTLI